MANKKTKFIQYLTASDGSFGLMRQGDIIECFNKTADVLVERGIAKIITEKDADNALNASAEQEAQTIIPQAKLYARGATLVTQSAAKKSAKKAKKKPKKEEEVPDPEGEADPGGEADPAGGEYQDQYGEQ